MAAFYKILILCIGFAFCGNTWAQSRLYQIQYGREFAEKSGSYLLTSERKCGMVMYPSFENRYGISLSSGCDTLTLIEMPGPKPVSPPFVEYEDSDGKPIPEDENEKSDNTIKLYLIGKIAIDPVKGKKLAGLIDVAVKKSVQKTSFGLDGTSYFFYASNGGIAETWSPNKNSNCGKLVEVFKTLKKAIKDNNVSLLTDEWWASLDRLRLSFQAPVKKQKGRR